MKYPWDLEDGWDTKGAAKFHLSKGSPGWSTYVANMETFSRNSFRVPSYASFIINGLFALIVFYSAAWRILSSFDKVKRWTRRSFIWQLWSKHIANAPLFDRQHAEVYTIAGSFITFKAPLRGSSILISGLIVANLVTLCAFYTTSQPNRPLWTPFYEKGRYMADRAALLAVSQLVPLVLLSGRNSVVRILTDASFETCMLYHRWFARIVFVEAMLHALGYSISNWYGRSKANYLKLFKNEYIVWGLVAVVSLGFLTFASMRWFRRKAYEIFMLVHIVFAILGVATIYVHVAMVNKGDGRYDALLDYLRAAIAFYAFDKVLRIFRLFYYNIYWSNGRILISSGTTKVVCNVDSGTVLQHRIVLEGIGARNAKTTTAAGQSIQLWLPRLQPFSSHPFTVASMYLDSDQRAVVVLYTKVHKGVTRTLLSRSDKKHLMLVEGFYDSLEDYSFYAFRIMAAGGIGITNILPRFLQAKREGLQTYMLWVIPDYQMLCIAREVLESENKWPSTNAKEPLTFRFDIYISRKGSASKFSNLSVKQEKDIEDLEISQSGAEKEKSIECASYDEIIESLITVAKPLGITINVKMIESRPILSDIVQNFIDCEPQKTAIPQEIQLVSCGPSNFCDNLRYISRKQGLTYSEEAFQW